MNSNPVLSALFPAAHDVALISAHETRPEATTARMGRRVRKGEIASVIEYVGKWWVVVAVTGERCPCCEQIVRNNPD